MNRGVFENKSDKCRLLFIRGEIPPYYSSCLRPISGRYEVSAVQLYSRVGLAFDFERIHGGSVIMPPEGTGSLSRWVEEHMRGFSPDAVFVGGWGTKDLRDVFRVARKQRVPAVLENDTPMGYIPWYSWKRLAHRLFAAKYISAGFVPGNAARQYLRSVGVSVVQTGLYSRDCVSDVKSGEGTVETGAPFCLLYVGRLVPEKNVSLLIRAFRRVRSSLGGAVRLVVVGEGPEEAALKAISGDEVVFTGMVQPDGLASIYSEASALVLPSTFEPWGMVVEEAYAHGLTAILSSKCGCTELMREGLCSFGFNPYSLSSLEAAIRECHAAWLDPQRRYKGAQAARSLAMSYDATAWGKRIDALLAELGLPMRVA